MENDLTPEEREMLEALQREEEILAQACDVEKIFEKEAKNIKVEDIIIRELKYLDQYGDQYLPLIEKHQTAKAICGYVSSGIIPVVQKNIKPIMEINDINKLVEPFNTVDFMKERVENTMKFIQSNRREYVDKNKDKFEDKESDDFMTAWMFNYEMSDYIDSLTDKDNDRKICFFRTNVYGFPEQVEKAKNLEVHRNKEDLPFKDEKFLIETFNEKKKINTMQEFLSGDRVKQLREEKEAIAFIGDLGGYFGHFVTLVACHIKNNEGKNEKNLLLINSTKSHSIQREQVGIFAKAIFNQKQ